MVMKFKKNMLWLQVLVAGGVVGLTGCSSSLNSQFDCPKQPGVFCKSLGAVNAAVNRGDFSGNVAKKATNTAGRAEFSNPYPPVVKSGEPLRYGERVIRIWIAPYEDDIGNYHQGTIISTVAKKGRWLANPPRELLRG